MDSLARSYEYCRQVARTQARNFYYSFKVLPPEKQAAMCAIYAFMRFSDDLSDDDTADESRKARMSRWREALDRVFEGEYGDSLILPAFHDVTRRYEIPRRFFHELIDGTEMDLTTTRYETFDELYKYCYRVASVVGFVCIHVWGFEGGESAYAPAEACGIAFQLTNILRDVKEDAGRGRIYLPQEDLKRFGCREESLLAPHADSAFVRMMEFEVSRAREHYEKARPLIHLLSPDGKAAFTVMYRIYQGLLDRIQAGGYDVLRRRARLSSLRKVGIMAQVWTSHRLPSIRT